MRGTTLNQWNNRTAFSDKCGYVVRLRQSVRSFEVSIDISPEDHQELKAIPALKGLSIRDSALGRTFGKAPALASQNKTMLSRCWLSLWIRGSSWRLVQKTTFGLDGGACLKPEGRTLGRHPRSSRSQIRRDQKRTNVAKIMSTIA